MSAFDYLKSTITQYRAGTSDDPYIDITESRKVIRGQIQLNEIPVFANKVRINNMFEVPPTDTSDIKENEYRVDYIEGIISFHPSAEGKMVTVVYKGRGNHFVSAARVWTHEENGDVKQTLQDVTDAASNFFYSGAYSPTALYETYNIVRYLGSSYICIKQSKGNDPTNTEYWSLLFGYNFMGTYSSQISYSSGDVVVDENNYRMLQSKTDNNKNNPLTDATNWQLLLDLTSVVTEANTATQSANVATQNANKATQDANQATQDAITAKNNADDATTNANNATIAANNATTSANNLVETFVTKGQYNSTTTYSVNNIVLYNGSSWRCIKSSKGNTPSESEFWTLIAIKGVDGQGAVSTINGLSPDQSGNISITADEVGAETPAGAQAKIDALAGVGNTKTVAEVSSEVVDINAQLSALTAKKAIRIDGDSFCTIGDGKSGRLFWERVSKAKSLTPTNAGVGGAAIIDVWNLISRELTIPSPYDIHLVNVGFNDMRSHGDNPLCAKDAATRLRGVGGFLRLQSAKTSDDPSITYIGNWQTTSTPSEPGGEFYSPSVKYTSSQGDYVETDFEGDGFTLGTFFLSDIGATMELKVDGVVIEIVHTGSQALVDYSPTALEFSGFGPGVHTLRVTKISNDDQNIFVDYIGVPRADPPTVYFNGVTKMKDDMYSQYAPDWNKGSDSVVESMNKEVRKALSNFDSRIVFVDQSDFDPDYNDLLLSDNVHPNALGHEWLASNVIKRWQ